MNKKINVKIYSKGNCSYCNEAKSFFEKRNIEFNDVDVADNLQKHDEMVDISGQHGVPVIIIDDKIIIGFNKKKINNILEIKLAK